VPDITDEDLERLGARIAMLVSEPGEADNAGRAIASLARRMGVSGGQLKDIFLTGALAQRPASPRSAGQRGRADDSPEAATQIEQFERELSAVRHSMKLTEVQARNALRERDALRVENGVLLDALDRARSAAQVRKYVGLAVLAAAVAGTIAVLLAPQLASRPDPRTTPAERPANSPFHGAGVVRTAGASVLREPEMGATMLLQLSPGARVQVRQTLWRTSIFWMEIEVGGIVGFVLSSEIDRMER